MNKKLMSLSLEEIASGKAENELEKVYYARLTSPDALEIDTIEKHEQWQIKFPLTPERASGGRMRIRKTEYEDGRVQYALTVKTRNPDGSDTEITSESTEDAFNQFKLLSEGGMKKTRYTVLIPGRPEVWEVDRFEGTDWCKIDLEIKDNSTVIPDLPGALTEVIQGNTKDPVQAEFIKELYRQFFSVPNEHLTN